MNKKQKGMVYLVGAGPGAPDLITVKGLKCIQQAEVIVYDRLVSLRLLKEAPDDAELIYVGKMPERHTLNQEEINQTLVDKARDGFSVVRLKGGDPFVFGRGGEEALALAEAGIPFEIVPGITSAVAVPAYAGIPITHRNISAGFSVITGHEDPQKEETQINWKALSLGKNTLVVLMGIGNLPEITARLIKEGKDPLTPAALIYRGTEAVQSVLIGSLGDIAAKAEKKDLAPPAIFIVGDVVRLREQLQWYEKKPLFGLRVVVSRAREQASEFSKKLEELGADTIEFPSIRIAPPENYDFLDRALENLSLYKWVVFTSVNGVEAFFRRLAEKEKDIRDLKGSHICAIGPKTGEALEERGLRIDYLPVEYRAEALADLISPLVKKGEKVLLPRAEQARDVLPEALKSLGAVVDTVAAYRTLPGDKDPGLLKNMLKQGAVDMVTFTSSSTVRNLVAMIDDVGLLGNVTVASIGPITSATAGELGLQVDIEAEDYTIDGLVEAITRRGNGVGLKTD